MQLSHLQYIKLVIADYKKKQKDGGLSPLLTTCTRASIRQECLNVYTERIKRGEREETNTLRAFFGLPDAGGDFTSLIEWYELDKFRPLENLMKDRIQSPTPATVELLAWLIDFKHRPYATGMNVLLNEDELATIKKKKNDPANTPEAKKQNEESKDEEEATLKNRKGSKEGSKGKPAIAILLMAVTFLGGMYIIGQRKGFRESPFGNGNTGCMYWTGDHYEAIPCSQKMENTLVIALDSFKLNNFKKISTPDTITLRSKGKLWYIKIKGNLEFYTSGGHHPVDPKLKLRPTSEHIIKKYIQPANTEE